MRRFLHAWWPVAVVVLFTVTLVLQIPRKALFFVPVHVDPVEPFVSFVSLDDDAYTRLVSRIRTTWQMRGRPIAGGIADSRTDAFDFSDPLPPPAFLPLRAVAEAIPLPSVSSSPRPSLLPPSLACEMPPIPAVRSLPDRDPDLLALPTDLPDVRPSYDFTLKKHRSIIQ